jgi:energy-coupling factor transport system permease protein
MRKAADTFHPCVGLAYFFAVIAEAMLFMNPFYIASGLLFAITAGFIYCGYKTVLKTLLLGLPVCLLIAVFNPLISQGGITPLFFIGGSAFTLEALFYGICSGGMLVLMLLWFCSFNRIVPPEKFLFLFSKISPAASMLVTMTQRMIGLFERRVRAITAAQKTLLCGMSQGSVRARFKSGIRITSILLSWSMEEGLDTADSMKARGYGAAKRSAFSLYRFRLTDAAALFVIAACFAVCLAGYYASARFRFYPMIVMPAPTTGYFVSMAAFALLGLLPVFAEITEAISWRY